MSESHYSGYIDVKVPSKGRKFGPWKAWKKQWCTIAVTNGNTVEVGLGYSKSNLSNSIIVPINANICRSESRTRSYAFGIFLPESKYRRSVLFLAGSSETESQKWMSWIRSLLKPNLLPVANDEFLVSLIDNKSSRNAGLYGTYGILSLSSIDMTIRHPNNGKVSVTWKWSHIEYAKLVIPSQNQEDTEKILVLRLVSDCPSKSEDSELLLYCESAADLQSAISRYRSARQHRLMTSPLPPTPVSRFNSRNSRLHSARRLSRSEGDLRWPLHALPAFHNAPSRSGSRDRNSSEHQDAEPNSLGKIAKTLISASFGLMLSTPGCSEPDTSHDYQNFSTEDLQYVEYHHIDSELDDLPDLRFTFHSSFSNRRESGSSIASGIYEEIENQPSEIYQYSSVPDAETCKAPPPLPPRKSDFYNKILHRRIRNCEEKEISRLPREAQNGVDCQLSRAFSEPDYLPMSPGTFKQNSEDAYVVMGNLITHKKIITTEPVPM